MGVAITVDTAAPLLKEIQSAFAPANAANELGPRCSKLVRQNFLSLGENKKGWPSTQFWARAAEATTWAVEIGDRALNIICNQIGVRQRLEGGDIRPVNAGALTRPADPEAYGKSAREFSNLRFAMQLNPETGRIMPCLVEAEASQIKIGKARTHGNYVTVTHVASTTGKHVMYWLAGGVHQDPNPGVLPSNEDWNAAFDRGVENLLRRL